jgi:pimeloyl-ACP methyl ester carboxylesterase
MLVRDPIEDRLPRIAAPTLVVAGTRDPVSPLEWAEQAAHLLPHGSLKVIEGGTHTLNYAYPHAFALAITPFLRGEAVPPARDSTGQPTATNST